MALTLRTENWSKIRLCTFSGQVQSHISKKTSFELFGCFSAFFLCMSITGVGALRNKVQQVHIIKSSAWDDHASYFFHKISKNSLGSSFAFSIDALQMDYLVINSLDLQTEDQETTRLERPPNPASFAKLQRIFPACIHLYCSRVF